MLYLAEQKKRHPAMTVRDAVKLCYQAAYGAEHLLHDGAGAREYLEREFTAVEPEDGPLVEPIAHDVCRIDLRAWKFRGLPLEWLWRMFSGSAAVREDGKARFAAYLREAEALFPRDAWRAFMDSYDGGAVRHSEDYRRAERPAYRIVHHKFARILPMLEKIWANRGGKCVVAIDGRAASGKTTMAAALETVLDCGVVHMDDFFLPGELRTARRLAEPGGNVHYERFAAEVLPHLRGGAFAYRVFDCGKMDYHGERTIGAGEVLVVEGSYSCHPALGGYADITVFSDVEAEEQKRRILARNGAAMWENFRDRWVPMEEHYFAATKLREKVDMIL